jgi:hypothetical protein
MAIKLFITPQQIAQTTIMGGNVDVDKFNFCIDNVQVTVIEPLLGTELYDKMLSDFPTYTGLYATLYTEYVQPIVKYQATAEYIEISSYTLGNGGLFKHAPENQEIVDKEEAQFLAQKYSAMAQMYVQRFNKWICKNTIAEYKHCQDDVNADGDIKLTAGWYFGR